MYLLGCAVDKNTPFTLMPNPTLAMTLRAMREEAHKGKKNLSLRRLVEEICEHLTPGDYNSEILAIYYWVCQNVRYMRDPHDVEFVKTPIRTIETESGDCDDMATLLAAMLMACGNQTEFVVIDYGTGWSHVYCQVLVQGAWVVVDPVAGSKTQEMLGRTKRFQRYKV